mgnify:CR=1 FL=1
MKIKDNGGTDRVLVKSGSLSTVGGGTQYIGNKSFEEQLGSLSAGRNFVGSINSWSFSEGGAVNISLTDRNAFPDDDKAVRAMDVLFPGIGEIIGGSQREERLDVLKKRMTEMGIDEKELWWYLDLRKYGTVPHSGFGLGFERMVMFCTGMSNIRDVIPYPRTPKNASF